MNRKILFCLWACLISGGLYAQIIQPQEHFRHIGRVNAGYAYYQSRLKTAEFIGITQGTALLGTRNIRTKIGLQTWQGSFQISHSDFWRQNYYSGADSGWYDLTAQTWRIGGYFSALLNSKI